MRRLLLLAAVVVTAPSVAAQKTEQQSFNESLCDGRALLAKASVESRDRKQPLAEWQYQLIKSKEVLPPDNLLARVALKGVEDAEVVYRGSSNGIQAYQDFYKVCMDGYGYQYSFK